MLGAFLNSYLKRRLKKALDTFPDDNDTFHMKDGEERICAAQGIIATF